MEPVVIAQIKPPTEIGEPTMIASPCKGCPNINWPKDECSKTCDLILGVQKIAAMEPMPVSDAIDYADDHRFCISAEIPV